MTPDWLQAITAIVSLLFTIISVRFVWYQVRSVSRQLMIQNFSEYTRRYQQIILELPDNVNQDDFELDRPEMVPDRNRYMRQMRAYCDMCFEEYWMNKIGLIDRRI